MHSFGKTLAAYRALETLLEAGKVRGIGVSNFMVQHLIRLLEKAKVVPAIFGFCRSERDSPFV